MAHAHRFHATTEELLRPVVTLEGSEAHHALHVCRLRPGDPVSVFDGAGNLAEGRIMQADKKNVRMEVDERIQAPRPNASLTIIQASLHSGPALEFLVTRSTELAVDRIVLFRAERSERAPQWPPRLVKTAIEAAKQCHNLWLPVLETAASLQEALRTADAGTLLTATFDLAPTPLRAADLTSNTAVVVGPEGDFTDKELAELSSLNARPLSLGNTVFRAEVAAALAATLVQYERGRLGPLA